MRLLSFSDYLAAAAAALVAVAHLFATSQLFLGSGTDIISQEYPFQAFAREWMLQKVLPLWNPFAFGGVPFQAGVHGYLYPGLWPGLLAGGGLGIKLDIAIHLVLAAVGGVYCARGLVKDRVASFAAGAAIALSGFFVSHLFAGHRIMVATAAYLPWIAGIALRALACNRILFFPALLAGGLMLLSGHYQMIFFGGLGIGLFALSESFCRYGFNKAVWQPLGKTLATLALAFGGGAFIAAVQVLPMADLVSLSQRAQGSGAFAASFSSSPANLLSFLWPNAFGNMVDAPFIGDWAYWESLGYFGLAPLGLAIYALAVLPLRRTLACLLTAILGIVLCLGNHTPLFAMYAAIVPGADLFRAAGRYVVLAPLFFGLLAALGMDAMLSATARGRRLIAGCVAVSLLCAMALGLFALVTGSGKGPAATLFGAVLDLKVTNEIAASALPALNALVARDAKMALLWLGATVLAIAVGGFKPRWARAASIALAGLVLLDLYGFGHRFMKSGPQDLFELPAGLAEHATREGGPGVRLIPPHEMSWGNFPSMHGIGNPGGYDTFVDGRYARYLNRARGKNLEQYVSMVKLGRGSRLLHHLGARYLLASRPESEQSLASRGYAGFKYRQAFGSIQLYEDMSPAPRAALVHKVEVVADEFVQYSRMEADDFDVSKVALIDALLPAGFANPEPAVDVSRERAVIRQYTPNRVAIEVTASSAAALVLSDTLQPGWTATVDGADVPLVHANRVMRFLPVPAGDHIVEMRYLPRSFTLGLALSLASLAFLAAAAFIRQRRNQRAPAAKAAEDRACPEK